MVIDAYRVASDSGMAKRINTIMQTCFFAISGVLPEARAIAAIKAANPAAWERENYLSVLDSFTPPPGVRY